MKSPTTYNMSTRLSEEDIRQLVKQPQGGQLFSQPPAAAPLPSLTALPPPAPLPLPAHYAAQPGALHRAAEEAAIIYCDVFIAGSGPIGSVFLPGFSPHPSEGYAPGPHMHELSSTGAKQTIKRRKLSWLTLGQKIATLRAGTTRIQSSKFVLPV